MEVRHALQALADRCVSDAFTFTPSATRRHMDGMGTELLVVWPEGNGYVIRYPQLRED